MRSEKVDRNSRSDAAGDVAKEVKYQIRKYRKQSFEDAFNVSWTWRIGEMHIKCVISTGVDIKMNQHRVNLQLF